MTSSQVLLLVDDEENIVKSLSRTLRRDGYEILTASSGESALEILENHNVGVIISDQRMPGMTGSVFLSKAKEIRPDSIRIMLSGYTELNSVTGAVNEGNIFKFLSKPWEDDFLRKNVREAFEYYELIQENKRLSSDYKKLNQELESRVVERTNDLALTLKILQFEQSILEDLSCCVVAIDDSRIIVNANKKAHELFDKDSQGLVGHDVNNIMPQEILSLLDKSVEPEVNTPVQINGSKMLTNIKSLNNQSLSKGTVITCMHSE